MTDLAAQLLDLARQKGATQAEVYQTQSDSAPVTFEANRLKQLERSQSTGTALRLWKDDRPGLAVAYGAVDPETLVDRALALTDLNAPETPELAPAQRLTPDPKGTGLPVAALVEIGERAIAELRSAYPEILCSGELSCGNDRTLLMNSAGLYCDHRETSLSYYFGVEWVRGEDFLGIYDGDSSLDQLDPTPVIAGLRQRIAWAEETCAGPQGKMPVILTPHAAGLLWGTVSAALNGKQVQDGSSPWGERLEEKVMDERLSLSQDPTRDPHSCPFDDEGTPSQHLPLIQGGKVGCFYGDRTTARKLGIAPTGNGFRPSLGRYPSSSLINLIVSPGAGGLESWIGDLDCALVVDQMLGQGADLSGDFSVNVELGYLVKNGAIVGRVKDTMIAGNVYQLLNQIDRIGEDRRWIGATYTPSLLIQDVSVTA